MDYLMYYLLTVNAAGFLLMLIDKEKARKNRWRIRESVLLGTAAIGGSIGVFAGMQAFRHKTLHKRFSIGVPAMMTAQVALALYILYQLR
jgi:uncharacterized membrane protein YsdA (DUF1294 family)